MAPHGIFPCAEPDEWIAIAIRNDDEWRTLARLLPLAAPDRVRFARYEVRRDHEDELEGLIELATRSRSRWQLANTLQAAGVPAVPVESVVDHLAGDPGMRDRWTSTEHPYGMTFLVQNQVILPAGQLPPNKRAPMIGEHTDDILRELGFSPSAIADLFAAGILY